MCNSDLLSIFVSPCSVVSLANLVRLQNITPLNSIPAFNLETNASHLKTVICSSWYPERQKKRKGQMKLFSLLLSHYEQRTDVYIGYLVLHMSTSHEFYEYYSLLLVTKNVSRVTIKPVWEKFKTLQKILLWFSLVL